MYLNKTVETDVKRLDVIVLVGGILFSFAFLVLIWWAGPRLDAIELLPDQGASWYYWKLPEPTFWSRATAWGFYLAHQITFWWLIYYSKKYIKRYSTSLHLVNIVALAMNAFFIGLHFLQSHVWYDGLAQNVYIWSSQVSVIIMLVWILLLKNSRRGLLFGKKAPISNEINRFAASIMATVSPGQQSIPSGIIPWSAQAGICLASYICIYVYVLPVPAG
jgi:hypothetical protein